MDRLVYKQGDLFSAPAGSFLLHACNCQGSFGAGVALAFKMRYPRLYEQYNAYCKRFLNPKRSPLVGQSLVLTEGSTKMVCLFTSNGYGKFVDSPSMIIDATEKSLEHLSQNPLIKDQQIEIHSPKINSGLFRVNWSKTEAKIIQFLEKNKNATWVVWSL